MKMLPKINIGVFNSRSLCNKTAGVFEILQDIALMSVSYLKLG